MDEPATPDQGLEDVPDVGGQPPNPRAPPKHKVSNIEPPETKTGLFGSSSNLVNAIVGAGIIGIPFAIKESGFIAGVLLLVLVGVFTDKSLRIIFELATFNPKLKDLHVLTFEDMMEIPFGRWGRLFILISMFVLAYGAMVAYLLIVKDTVPTVFGLKNSFVEREVVMLVTSLLIMLPLSMLRDISQLALTSTLSVLADVVLVVIVCIYAPVEQAVGEAGGFGGVLADNWISSGFFIGLGVISTAMACQHSSFLISGSLTNNTQRRWACVTGSSLFTATMLTLILGVVGYLGFLDDTQGDVLNNFDPASHLVNAARALLAITMFFTYPLESFVARHVLVQLLFNGNMDKTTVGNDGEVVPERKILGYLGRRELWAIYLYVAALIPALIVDDLGPVLSITGSLGASSIAYIAPGLVYLGVNGDHFLEWTGQALQNRGFDSNKNVAPNGEVELPVAGDARATIETVPDASFPDGRKPWWWWPLLMPIWVAIASSGCKGTKTYLSALGQEVGRPLRGPSQDEDEVVVPRPRDYIWSAVFITFGILAAVCGLASNIYVQVKSIFFTF